MKRKANYFAGWLLTFGILVAVGLLSALTISYVRSEAKQMAIVSVPRIISLAAANKSLAQAFNDTLQAIIETDQAERQRLITQVNRQSQATGEHLDRYSELVRDEQEQRLLDNWKTARRSYLETRDRTLKTLQDSGPEAATEVYGSDLKDAFRDYEQAGLDLLEMNADAVSRQSKDIVRRTAISQILAGAIAIGLFAAGFLLGFYK